MNEIITYLSITFLIWSLPQIWTQILITNTHRKTEGLISAAKYLYNELYSCFKCTSFWLTLIVSQDIVLASSVALIAFVIMSNQTNLKA